MYLYSRLFWPTHVLVFSFNCLLVLIRNVFIICFIVFIVMLCICTVFCIVFTFVVLYHDPRRLCCNVVFWYILVCKWNEISQTRFLSLVWMISLLRYMRTQTCKCLHNLLLIWKELPYVTNCKMLLTIRRTLIFEHNFFNHIRLSSLPSELSILFQHLSLRKVAWL